MPPESKPYVKNDFSLNNRLLFNSLKIDNGNFNWNMSIYHSLTMLDNRKLTVLVCLDITFSKKNIIIIITKAEQ